MWFDLEAVDLSFTKTAPYRVVNEVVVSAPAARVFEILATGEGQREWFKDFREIRWTTAAPSGVGATREVELAALTVKERFVAWDEGKRLAFTIYAITVPIVDAMLEDMEVTAIDERSSKFTWRVYYRPSTLGKLVRPIAASIFEKMFASSARGLARYAADRPRG